jgi:hypothetical protein
MEKALRIGRVFVHALMPVQAKNYIAKHGAAGKRLLV